VHEPARNAHAKLKAVVRTDNPYSLIAIFGRGHLAIKAGHLSIYATMYASVEVVPLITQKQTAWKRASHLQQEEIFVDPIATL
jgi:hypothetical protein